jgi:vancomycin resistance protein YoaR
MILPGEEFSFNEATGERTAAKGYQVAHVLNAGVEDNGLAGGVCQTSGTLFNAAARANLTIVKRYPHSIPSSYLFRGQDATVDYPRKDLILRNDGEKPVIIAMTVDSKSPWKVTAEIYGTPLPAGETIELESKVTKVLPKLGTYRIEDSDAVDPGQQRIIEPRDGYVIAVYRIYKKDDVEINREHLDTVTYSAYGTVLLYNPADAKPSGLPTPTPSASPSPAPSATPQPATPAPTATPKPATPEPTEPVEGE